MTAGAGLSSGEPDEELKALQCDWSAWRSYSPSFTEPPNSEPLSKASFHVKVKQSCEATKTRIVCVICLVARWRSCVSPSNWSLPGSRRRGTWARRNTAGHSIWGEKQRASFCRNKEKKKIKEMKSLVLRFRLRTVHFSEKQESELLIH